MPQSTFIESPLERIVDVHWKKGGPSPPSPPSPPPGCPPGPCSGGQHFITPPFSHNYIYYSPFTDWRQNPFTSEFEGTPMSVALNPHICCPPIDLGDPNPYDQVFIPIQCHSSVTIILEPPPAFASFGVWLRPFMMPFGVYSDNTFKCWQGRMIDPTHGTTNGVPRYQASYWTGGGEHGTSNLPGEIVLHGHYPQGGLSQDVIDGLPYVLPSDFASGTMIQWYAWNALVPWRDEPLPVTDPPTRTRSEPPRRGLPPTIFRPPEGAANIIQETVNVTINVVCSSSGGGTSITAPSTYLSVP
jgi:hypothetical protein